ncbi:hypothetical protein [Motilimonas sp. KMU-193]|uniref:hypothetical protein n=1 Tax=Motilimonas sp. KMU-193 TaxID=3388668 RepID=UPI00396B18C8
MKKGFTVRSFYPLILFTTLLMPMAFAADSEQEANESLCEYESQENTMLDKAYDYLNTKMCEPALWFDDFFVDERISEDARAGTMVRWYNDFKYTEGEGFDYKTRLSARVHIPKATKRLKLVFDNDADDKVADLFPGSSDDTKNTLGLQYDWFVKGRSSLNFKLSFHPGIEARYRYTYPISDATYARLTQKVYQKKKETGSTTSVDLDHRLNENFLIRWNNFVKFSTEFDGSELGTGLTLYQYLSDKRALAYEASLYGKTQPYRFLANQRLAVRYRQNILRKWFFYEITPAIEWPKEEDEPRRDEASITLRLEVLFNNI